MLEFKRNHDLKGYSVKFPLNFYNTLKFVKHQEIEPIDTFSILNKKKKTVHGIIHFTAVGQNAFSLPKSPFGGYEFDSLVDDQIFHDFCLYVQNELKSSKFKKIKIIEAPDVYVDELNFDTLEVLKELGYETSISDINHFVNLDDVDGISLLSTMERRHFRKALAKNYRWKLESADALPEVYSFIERCREQQKLKVNISFEDLQRSFKAFPGKYRILSIRHNGYLTATSITVEVNKNIIYNYLPASDKKFKQDSPMVFLLVNLYKYAKSMNYQILDLGLSSVKGKIQTGLAEFKERMGASICEKRILEKVL
ncbi:MAG: GNAT family N-acetyltransferase [Cyclobacteriaceae bacterium]